MEYLGYTCGHTSPAVLRTCPQTTGIPTNPVCKNPATRPQLMASFCVACAHVQHKRWSDIMEQEHRWLHERGACGCPVKFPDLMQPRMVVGGGRRGSHGVLSADGTVCTIVGGADVTAPSGGSAGGGGGSGEGGGGGDNSQHHHHRGSGFGKKGNKRGGKNWRRGGGGGGGGGGYSQNSHDQPNRAQQQKDKYPALQEIREGDDVRYAVRLPSMYGVEWAWDHEKLHREGKCPCAVRFDKHVPQHNLPNTQHSLVQPAEYTATGSGNQAYNATFSGNDFLATRPFEQSSSEQPSAQSATIQSSAAYPSDVQSSMQNWVQPIMQPSEQHLQQQRYGQQTSATQNPHTQTERPQISSAQIFDMQGYQYSMQDMAQSSGEHNSQRHSNNNNNNNSTQAFGQPFEPRNNTQTTGGTDPFSQTMPDSIMDLFAQQPEDGNAAPPPSVSSYTMPTVPIDGDGMAAWNLSQPQRWTCNPPEGYYNAQEVYLPPAFPSTNTNTDTSETDTIRPLTAHGASAAASSNNYNYNYNYSNTGSSSNANRNNKGKSKADDNTSNNAPSGSGGGGGGGFGYGDPPRPVDMQTMWFSSTPQEGEHNAQPPVVGLPIGRGPEGADGALQAPGQTYHHEQQQPEDGMIPFNGFPIGAGPEGDPHAGSFDECEFYRTNTTTSNKSSSTSGARRDRHGRGLRRPSSSSF